MLKTLITASALAFIGGTAVATTVTNTPFDFRAITGPDEAQANVIAQSEAGFCDPFDGSGCDGGVTVGGGSDVFVDWVDGDSFDIGISGDPLDAFSITMTGVAFDGGAEATDLSFNLFGSDPFNDLNIADFLFDPVNNPSGPDEPTISTSVFFDAGLGTNNLFISFENVSSLLWADAVTARFDVSLAGGVPVVPLPAGGALLLSGLAGMTLLRRRQRNTA